MPILNRSKKSGGNIQIDDLVIFGASSFGIHFTSGGTKSDNWAIKAAVFQLLKIDGSALLYFLDEQGIFVSSGSACTAKHNYTPHVLKAIEVPLEYINGTVRITLSGEFTREELDYAADT